MDTLNRIAAVWGEWITAQGWQLALLALLVGAAAWAARRSSPRVRLALWWLVFLKLALPPALGAGFGIGAWAIEPLRERLAVQPPPLISPAAPLPPEPIPPVLSAPAPTVTSIDPRPATPAVAPEPVTMASEPGPWPVPSPATSLMLAWAAVAAGLLLYSLARNHALIRRLDRLEPIEEGPLRVELERLAVELRVTPPRLYLAPGVTSPFLCGLLAPRLVLPTGLPDSIGEERLRHVLLHELAHLKRRDLAASWLQLLAHCVFWFHPLLWWAGARLRHERECACDELALTTGRLEPRQYGESILQVILTARARPASALGLPGVFERHAQLQERLETIMRIEGKPRAVRPWSWALVLLFALIALPMGAASRDAQPGDQGQYRRTDPQWDRPFVDDPHLLGSWQSVDFVQAPDEFKPGQRRFRGELQLKGMDFLPGGRTSQNWHRWTKGYLWHSGDQAEGGYEIRTIDGRPYLFVEWISGDVIQRGMKPSFYVLTKTAAEPKAGRTPRIVETFPAAGASEVDPASRAILVRFDRDMAGGFSWTGAGEYHPTLAEGARPRWIDKRTCEYPVRLEPGRFYRIGINSTSHRNFRSAEGTPARPSAIWFTTKGADAQTLTLLERPRVLEMTPANGAQDVDPATSELRVTFNVPMGGGFSWTGGGENYPEIPDGGRPRWSEDRKTCTLPVRLKPDWSYRLGLNSPSHQNFSSQGGLPLEPVITTFRTRAR